MPGKIYSEEFKEMIKSLYKNGKGKTELSREYGMSVRSLTMWFQESKEPDRKKAREENIYLELKNLRKALEEKDKELNEKEEEIEILKKATAILMKR